MPISRTKELEELASLSHAFLKNLDAAGVLRGPGQEELQLHAQILGLLLESSVGA